MRRERGCTSNHSNEAMAIVSGRDKEEFTSPPPRQSAPEKFPSNDDDKFIISRSVSTSVRGPDQIARRPYFSGVDTRE